MNDTLTARYQRFARIALQLASEADYDVTYQLCALVVKRNRVLSVGYNQPKTHPISVATPLQQQHAEHSALIRCPEGLHRGSDLIVARVKPSGLPGLARPCNACWDVLRLYGIRRVFYTLNSDDADFPQIEGMLL